MSVSLAFVFIHYGMEKGDNLVTILVEIGIIDELWSFLVVWDCYFSCGRRRVHARKGQWREDTPDKRDYMNRVP